MDDLISRAALLEEFRSLCGPQTGNGWDNMGVRSLIMRQKSVDAVQAVRCNDCKYWTACESEENDCDMYGVCCQINRMTTYDWFCADGEVGNMAEKEGCNKMTDVGEVIKGLEEVQKKHEMWWEKHDADACKAGLELIKKLWRDMNYMRSCMVCKYRERQHCNPNADYETPEYQRYLDCHRSTGDKMYKSCWEWDSEWE